MKKLLLILGITSIMSLSTTAAYAGSDCPTRCDSCKKSQAECTCPKKCEPKCPARCEPTCPARCEPTCPARGEACGYMARSCFGFDCFEHRKEELYCRLDLDQCQKQEADCIINEHKSDFDCNKEQLKSDHRCLCEKIHASCLDKKAVREQGRVVKKDIRETKKSLKVMDKDFKKILKCDQKKEYRKYKSDLNYRLKKGQHYCCKPCNIE